MIFWIWSPIWDPSLYAILHGFCEFQEKSFSTSSQNFLRRDTSIYSKTSRGIPLKTPQLKGFVLKTNRSWYIYFLPYPPHNSTFWNTMLYLGIAEKFWDQILKAEISYLKYSDSNILRGSSFPYKSYFVKIPLFGKMDPNHKNGAMSGLCGS